MNALPSPTTLAPSALIDSDHPQVLALARAPAQGENARERAVALYLAVRDGFRDDPYRIDLSPAGMRASSVIAQGSGWCVPKAALMVAACRAAGQHARLGDADVRKHLSTVRSRQTMQTDVFIWHGYADIWLQGQWVKATPAFQTELCDKFGLLPLAFDGLSDSVDHPFDKAGQRRMEYMKQRGCFDDMPLTLTVADFQAVDPGWMAAQGALQNASFAHDLDKETQ